MGVIIPEWHRFKKVWTVSLKFGVQEGLVWELVRKHRDTVLGLEPPVGDSWPAVVPPIHPADYLALIMGEDFPDAARKIIEQDANWSVWANDVHTHRYLDRQMPTAHERLHRKLRPGVLDVIRQVRAG